MSLPLPDTPLGDHCSALFNRTLYAFSSTAFQSLSLSKGAQWKVLPTGISTTGGQCVHAHKNTPQEALYIVGGTTSNSSTVPETGFMGLQRWLFNEKKWETLGLPVPLTYNLTNHGATFLETTQQILVFSGTVWPDTTTPSANTFLIETKAPFAITSIPAADPLLKPLVLPWGEDGALVVGGNGDNRGLRVYTTSTGWMPLAMSLEKALPGKGKSGASLMDGDDGSRMLYTYDLSTGPPAITKILVKDPDTATVRRRQQTVPSQLTVSTWPTYNSELAPKLSMDGISISYEGDMVVISPADDISPLAVFDARQNSWMNTTELLGINSDDGNLSTFSIDSGNPSTGTLSSGTSQASPASSTEATAEATTEATAADSSSGIGSVEILCIILGSFLGIALILGAVLFFLKRRKQRSEGTRRMSFQDRGASFMQEAEGPLPPRFPRFPRAAIDSWASKDIEKSKTPGPSAYSADKDGPRITTIGGVGVITTGDSVPIPPPGDRNVSPTRSSGWSKYFSGAETNLEQSYSGTNSAHSSTYTDASNNFHAPKTDLKEGYIHTNPYLHNAGEGVIAGGIGVVSGGLQRSGSKGLMLQEPGVGVHSPSGQRRGSVSSVGSSAYSSGVPESLIDNRNQQGGWSPVEEKREWTGRGPVASSVYPDSPTRIRQSGPQFSPGQNVDNLSWLNLRQ